MAKNKSKPTGREKRLLEALKTAMKYLREYKQFSEEEGWNTETLNSSVKACEDSLREYLPHDGFH